MTTETKILRASPRGSCFLSLLSLFGLICSCCQAEDIDFSRDIRPILVDRCFACHGPNEESRESGLRLDSEQAATAELPSGDGFAIVAGDAASSEVLHRIVAKDPSIKMPPPESHLKLSPAEIELIRKWIDQGAQYSKHWAFEVPAKSDLPLAPTGFEVANEIDLFVANRLVQKGLGFSRRADRYNLIRRLSLDLTGLPPSAEDVQRFLEDQHPDAYENAVDRLLDSPHFGERMALDWLDAARYADTNGYSIDGGRHMWLWRDWVIQAFNSNKPYDEFLIEQIAGDLLPNATKAQLIATGFQRNNMVTHEGGTIPAENIVNYNADRVKTLGESVLGLTLACAQCHDHKYDPITQKDYYRLFAYFNTLDDAGLDGDGGVNPRPYLKARTVLQTGEQDKLKKRIESLRQQLANPEPKDFVQWQQDQLRDLDRRRIGNNLRSLTVKKVSTPNRGSGFVVKDDRFVCITQPGGLAAYDILGQVGGVDQPIDGLRIVFHPDENAPGGGWGYGKSKNKDGKGNFVLTALTISAGNVAADQVDLFRLIKPRRVTASSWQKGFRPELCLDMRNSNGWSPSAEQDGAVQLTVTFDHPVDPRVTPFITTQLNFGRGDNSIAARLEIFAMTGVDDGSALPEDIILALVTENSKRTKEQTRRLQEFYAQHAPQTQRTRVDLENALERLDVLTTEFPTMIMNVASKPRDTFVLNRGDYSQPTYKVEMQTPEFLPKSNDDQTDRLALAKWITMPGNPLTARVYVNRVWQLMFGAGIVRTPADFGSQGSWPTHPELLDWLAVDFVQSDWDIKHLIKKVAMSETYRQSSSADDKLYDMDPGNRLLARGPRFRMPAEFVRDSALKVSGLLQDDLGGPSVNPYAPGDLWREISHYGSTPATAQTFVQDHGEKLYRRSLYTYWKRTSPPPNMAAFDAPNRETCVVSRPTTNTPLQALVTLNDVQFVEAARAFAQRIILRPGQDHSRIQWAMFEALSRPASEMEIRVLVAALKRERQRYRADADSAKKLIAIGESLRDEKIPIAEHAAWTVVASTILNLSEFVSRN